MPCGRVPVGHGLLLWQAGAERDERRAHGFYRFLLLPGYVAGGAAASQTGTVTGSEVRLLLICAFLGVPFSFLIQFTAGAHYGQPRIVMVGAMPVLLAAAAPLFAGARAAEERLDRFACWPSSVPPWARRSSHWAAAGPGAHGNRHSRRPADRGSLFTALAWILLSKK